MHVTIAHVPVSRCNPRHGVCQQGQTHTSVVLMQHGVKSLFCPSTAACHRLRLSPQQREKVTQVPGDRSSVASAPANTWKTKQSVFFPSQQVFLFSPSQFVSPPIFPSHCHLSDLIHLFGLLLSHPPVRSLVGLPSSLPLHCLVFYSRSNFLTQSVLMKLKKQVFSFFSSSIISSSSFSVKHNHFCGTVIWKGKRGGHSKIFRSTKLKEKCQVKAPRWHKKVSGSPADFEMGKCTMVCKGTVTHK